MNSQDDNKHLIERGIAQGGHRGHALTEMAKKGMLDFLRNEVIEAEWEIAKQKARIEAYQQAIAAIEAKPEENP